MKDFTERSLYSVFWMFLKMRYKTAFLFESSRVLISHSEERAAQLQCFGNDIYRAFRNNLKHQTSLTSPLSGSLSYISSSLRFPSFSHRIHQTSVTIIKFLSGTQHCTFSNSSCFDWSQPSLLRKATGCLVNTTKAQGICDLVEPRAFGLHLFFNSTPSLELQQDASHN